MGKKVIVIPWITCTLWHHCNNIITHWSFRHSWMARLTARTLTITQHRHFLHATQNSTAKISHHIWPYSSLRQWPVYFCDPKLKHSHQQLCPLCTFLASEYKAYTTTPTRHTTTTVSQLHAVPPFECHPGCEFQVKALRAHTETVDSLTLPVADSQMPPCKHHTPSLCTWFYLQKLTKQGTGNWYPPSTQVHLMLQILKPG